MKHDALRCETVTARDGTFLDLSLDIEQNSSTYYAHVSLGEGLPWSKIPSNHGFWIKGLRVLCYTLSTLGSKHDSSVIWSILFHLRLDTNCTCYVPAKLIGNPYCKIIQTYFERSLDLLILRMGLFCCGFCR